MIGYRKKDKMTGKKKKKNEPERREGEEKGKKRFEFSLVGSPPHSSV